MARSIAVRGAVLAWSCSVLLAACGTEGPSEPRPDPGRGPHPEPTDPVVVAAAGDIACGSETSQLGTYPCQHAATAALVRAMNPDAVLALGDLQYEQGALDDFLRYYDAAWGTFKHITYPVAGNHEYDTPKGVGYFDYFNGVGVDSGRAGSRTKGYYAFTLGSWRAIALNSNCARAGGCGAGSPQEQWLRAELAADPVRCTLAFWHNPRFASGGPIDTTSADYGIVVSALWQALEDHGADLVLSGHVHMYERLAPLTNTGAVDTQRGIRSFIVGTGGKNVHITTRARVGSEVRHGTGFGVLKLVLRDDGYDWDFRSVPGGNFSDAGSAACR